MIMYLLFSAGWIPDPLWDHKDSVHQAALPDWGSPAATDPTGEVAVSVPGDDRGRGPWETPPLRLSPRGPSLSVEGPPRPAAHSHVGHHQHQTLLRVLRQRSCATGSREAVSHPGKCCRAFRWTRSKTNNKFYVWSKCFMFWCYLKKSWCNFCNKISENMRAERQLTFAGNAETEVLKIKETEYQLNAKT